MSSGAALSRACGRDPALVAELVGVLRGPGVDLEPAALELAEDGDRARVILDRVRAGLVERLRNRSDDFAATSALQAVTSASARLASHTHPSEQDRLVDAGLSGVDRMRIWLRTRIGRQHPSADAAVRAAPRPKRLRLPFVRSGATRTLHPLPGTRVPSFGAPTARQHRAESESAQPQTTPAVIEPRP